MRFLKWRKAKPRPNDTKAESYRSSYEAQREKRLAPFHKTIQEGWHSDEREHHRIERGYWRLTTFLTFFAVAGAIATVIISNWTLKEAHKATNEARRQADEAALQVKISKDTEERQLRSYMIAERYDAKILTKGIINQYIQVRNGGQTPAYHVMAKIACGLFDFPFKSGIPPYLFGDKPISYGVFTGATDVSSVFGPGQSIVSLYKLANFSNDDYKKFQNRKKVMVISGVIYYDDIFGAQHHTKFCEYVTGGISNASTTCDKGNDAN